MACEEYDLRVKELRRESRKRKRDNSKLVERVSDASNMSLIVLKLHLQNLSYPLDVLSHLPY